MAPVRLSPHFTLVELTVTEHRDYLDEQDDPPASVRANLLRLVTDLLEPARAIVGPLRVNSGWRCPGLNRAIRGSKTSAHMTGSAADVVPLNLSVPAAFELLADSALPYDQVILEFNRWIHIGGPRHGVEPRRERLVIFEPGKYEKWVPSFS